MIDARRLQPHATLPLAAAVVVALNALYITLVAFGNITDFPSNQAFVQHVLAMDTTNFGAAAGTQLDPAVIWRAVTSPTLQTVAYLGVILWETASAAVLIAAVAAWIRDRGRGYGAARTLSTIGLLMIVTLFAGGFIAVGGEWFAMYRSVTWNGLDPAFRNSVLALIGIVLIHLPSGRWSADPIDASQTGDRTESP